jgi:hypothetical protein
MRALLLSCNAPKESIEQLSSLGYDIIPLPPHRALPEAISAHPDSLVFSGDDRLIVDRDYYLENEELFLSVIDKSQGRHLRISNDAAGNKYPEDTRLNAIILGGRLFCRKESISSAITDYAREKRLEIVNTRQGYPACSTLKISENAVICADRGLSALYKRHGISVYEIEPGSISLPPYEYGFIGGASITLDKAVCFFGDVTQHPSYEVIARALKEYSLTPISIASGNLRDLGGGILL